MKFAGKAGWTAVITAVVLTTAGGAFARGGEGGAAFDKMDANGDGFVTEAEFAAAKTERFNNLDANSDGGISIDEMIAHATERAAEMGKEVSADRVEARVGKMFEKMDADGDGLIQPSEQRGPEFAELLEKLDANEDGQLSKEEMAEMRGKGKFGKDRG